MAMSADLDPGFGFSLVRFEAEYPKSGFGILRLTPVYEPVLDLPKFESRTADAVLDNRRNGIYDDEIWERLPSWIKIVYSLGQATRNRSRQQTSTQG